MISSGSPEHGPVIIHFPQEHLRCAANTMWDCLGIHQGEVKAELRGLLHSYFKPSINYLLLGEIPIKYLVLFKFINRQSSMVV